MLDERLDPTVHLRFAPKLLQQQYVQVYGKLLRCAEQQILPEPRKAERASGPVLEILCASLPGSPRRSSWDVGGEARVRTSSVESPA